MRARSLLPPLALTLVAVPALAMWAWVPNWQLIPMSDLAVVATLDEVREWSDGGTDFGEGNLVVESVLFGEGPTPSLLRLEWANGSMVACPRVDQRQHEGERALWLLNLGGAPGVVTANYPGRFIPLVNQERVAHEHEVLKGAPAEARRDPRYRAVDSLLAASRH